MAKKNGTEKQTQAPKAEQAPQVELLAKEKAPKAPKEKAPKAEKAEKAKLSPRDKVRAKVARSARSVVNTMGLLKRWQLNDAAGVFEAALAGMDTVLTTLDTLPTDWSPTKVRTGSKALAIGSTATLTEKAQSILTGLACLDQPVTIEMHLKRQILVKLASGMQIPVSRGHLAPVETKKQTEAPKGEQQAQA